MKTPLDFKTDSEYMNWLMSNNGEPPPDKDDEEDDEDDEEDDEDDNEDDEEDDEEQLKPNTIQDDDEHKIDDRPLKKQKLFSMYYAIDGNRMMQI